MVTSSLVAFSFATVLYEAQQDIIGMSGAERIAIGKVLNVCPNTSASTEVQRLRWK